MVCYKGFILHKENDKYVGVKFNSDCKQIARIEADTVRKLHYDIDFYHLKHEVPDEDW